MRPASRGGEVVSSVAYYELRVRISGAGGNFYALLLLYLLEFYALYAFALLTRILRFACGCLSRILCLLACSTGKEPMLA